MTKHSKYYYDFTRNMSLEQIKKFHCGRPNCHRDKCFCMDIENNFEEKGFIEWASDLEGAEQPVCNIDDQEDCENCGS